MYCHCIVCGSTFNGAVIPSKYEIPCKCPDCGKKVAARHVPSVRAATDEEIKEYEKLKRKQLNHMYEMLHSNELPGAC